MFSASFATALENIYISPLELCNLACKVCYTNKTKNILSNAQITSFVTRHSHFLRQHDLKLKSILFCGGEVFALKNFPRLVNRFLKKGVFISIITNGTIDKLAKIKDPRNCQLLVSLDGPSEVHDHNRGQGNFDKTIAFINHALQLNFPVEIMFLVTPESYPYIDTFAPTITDLTGTALHLNYITQKTYFYTDKHPLATNYSQKPALSRDQILNVKRNYRTLPAKKFGCFQLTLQSNGLVYGCCETPHPLGKISDRLSVIVKKFLASLDPCSKCGQCGGCCDPEFICGYKKELAVANCTDVVKLFSATGGSASG